MIILHKLNGTEFILNAAHIETIEEKPDTTIALTNEKIYLVKESAEEVINLTVEYHQKIHSPER